MLKFRKAFLFVAITALACALLAVWVSLAPRSNPDYDASKPHHRPDGFINRYIERSDKPGLWRWQWERLRDGLPKPPAAPIIGVKPDLELINSDSTQPRLTWVGQSTLLFQIDGLNLLTDPHWGRRASPFSFAGPKRHQAPGIHLGTFDGMSDEPLDQPPKDLEIAKNESSSPLNFFVLKHGESWV
jgi:hypothetical protein